MLQKAWEGKLHNFHFSLALYKQASEPRHREPTERIVVAASCRLDRSFKHTIGALSFQMWCNFGLAEPWPGYALKDKYWRKLRGNSHKLEWLAVIPYAYKGKPLVDAAVKAIAQTSNYLHAMSCLFTNAAIQYK
jgi:hypothetical protein